MVDRIHLPLKFLFAHIKPGIPSSKDIHTASFTESVIFCNQRFWHILLSGCSLNSLFVTMYLVPTRTGSIGIQKKNVSSGVW